MTFRDDHDATLARAEALERELAAAKEKLAANEEQQALLRTEVASLRRIVEKPPPPTPERVAVKSSLIGAGFIAFAVAAMIFAFWYAKSMRESSRTTIESTTASCTLTSLPSGAEIFDGTGRYIGTTPITKPRRTWEGMDDVVGYEARLTGYQTARVILPTHGEDCNVRIRLLP